MTRQKKPKSRYRDLWGEANVITRIGAVAAALGVLVSSGYAVSAYTQSRAVETFGRWPWASKEMVEMIAQQTAYDVSVRQTSIQFEINRLKDKCARSCNQYESKALQNYIDEWQRNQRFIDAMRASRSAPMAAQVGR